MFEALVLEPTPIAIVLQVDRPRSGLVQNTLNLAAGERVVLRVGASGAFELVDTRIVGPENALPPIGQDVDIDEFFAAAPGTIAISLGLKQGLGSFLKIENRLGRALAYVGYIVPVRGGRPTEPERTTVCTVPTDKVGYEHWEEPVIQMVLGGLSVTDGDQPVCETEESLRPQAPADASPAA